MWKGNQIINGGNSEDVRDVSHVSPDSTMYLCAL